MEPIVSKSLPVSLNQHRSHGPILIKSKDMNSVLDLRLEYVKTNFNIATY